MVGGIQKSRLQSGWTRNQGRLGIFLVILGLLGVAIGGGLFDPFRSLALRLRVKLLLIFFLTSIIPLSAVVKFGWDRMRDTDRLNRGRWEERLSSTLGSLDADYTAYIKTRAQAMLAIENKLAADLAGHPTADRVRELLQNVSGTKP